MVMKAMILQLSEPGPFPAFDRIAFINATCDGTNSINPSTGQKGEEKRTTSVLRS
jgi:hypothetical protein